MNFSNSSGILESAMNSSNSSGITSNTTTLGVAYTFISISVMVANGVIIFVIAKSDELHMNALWVLTFRSVTDFSCGLYCLVFVVPSALLHQFAYSSSLIGTASCISTLLFGQTIFNIALTVIDRCLAVIKPLAYVRIVTNRNVILAVLFSISVNVIRFLMIVFPDADFYYNADIAVCAVDFDTTMNVVASVGIPLLTFIIIVITSCVIAAEIRRGRRRVNPLEANSSNEGLSKFLLMVMISVSVFCLSYSPFVISIVWNLPAILVKMTVIGVLSNSLWNVFIYTATYQPFREALIRLMCPKYYRQKRRNEMSS